MTGHRTNAEARCPACQHKLDGASHPGDDSKKPKPGDISVCISCSVVLEFQTDLTLRLAPQKVVDSLPFPVRMQIETLRHVIQRMPRDKP
jgi:hypothetical protein